MKFIVHSMPIKRRSSLLILSFRKVCSAAQDLCLTLRYITLDAYDVNVSPDKRTILIHHEGSLITELKVRNPTLVKSVSFHFLRPRRP